MKQREYIVHSYVAEGKHMNRLSIAVPSFILGALTMLMIHSQQTFARPQFDTAAAVPVVPLLGGPVHNHETIVEDPLVLDGVQCDNCVLAANTLVYGGGPFRLQHSALAATNLRLTGAAANAIAFLEVWNSAHGDKKMSAPEPNTPISKTAAPPDRRVTIDLSSPYGQRKP